MTDDPCRRMALGEELDTAVKLIRCGLKELQGTGGENLFFFLPQLLLSSGLERLFKVTLCLSGKVRTDAYPSRKEMREFGHSLVPLLDAVVAACFTRDYEESCSAARTDKQLLVGDAILREVVVVLEAFGKAARYYNLDVVSRGESMEPSPDEEWNRLRNLIIENSPDLKARNEARDWERSFYDDINRGLVVQLERLVRAITRLYTLGPIKGLGKRRIGCLGGFYRLQDHQLGSTSYAERELVDARVGDAT